jgi:2-dehydropantoate 2-reductase
VSLPFPKIAIVGSGAIGLYYGIRLALGGADVRFLMRADLPAVRQRGSLILKVEGKTKELRPVQAFATSAEIGPVDLVLIGVKVTGNAALPAMIAPLLHSGTALLTAQNGLGADEFLGTRFGRERVLGGLAFIANNRTGPGEVLCYHPGSLTLGELFGPPTARTHALADQFQAAGVKTRVAVNLPSAQWHKLVWNIPFNGLTITAGGIATDRICADPLLAEEARALMREVQAGAGALGYPIADDFLPRQFDVTPPMGAYRPSSLVDFQAGREVEIEAIWGEPQRRAVAAGAAVPRLTLLYTLLRRLALQR